MAETRIAEVLVALQRAVRQAEFDKFSPFLAELETFFASPQKLPEADLETIRRASIGLQTCLDAAMQGIRGAQKRWAEIESAKRLVTYDRLGQRRDHDGLGRSTRI